MKYRKKQEPDKKILYERVTPKAYFQGRSPNILIGSFGYPKVNVGTLSAEEYDNNDNPKEFAKKKLDINTLLKKRQALVNSKIQMEVRNIKRRYTEQAQEIAKSKQAVDTEVELFKPLAANMGTDDFTMPHGPSAQLKKLDITENPRIPLRIEQLTSDTDVKAQTAMEELEGKGFDEYYMTKLLSAGTLGQKRKLVPTKWAITAVDDTLSEKLRKQIIENDECNYEIHTGSYLGNEYIILFQPGDWSFELFEIAIPHCIYNDSDEPTITKDYEFAEGRRDYASQTTGAFYAAKLSVLNHFIKKKQQGRVVVYRIITEDYTVPLGVWVVREGVRLTLTEKETEQTEGKDEEEKEIFTHRTLHDRDELIHLAEKQLRERRITNINQVIGESKTLHETQKSLRKWF